jgi:hypothetical protein
MQHSARMKLRKAEHRRGCSAGLKFAAYKVGVGPCRHLMTIILAAIR